MDAGNSGVRAGKRILVVDDIRLFRDLVQVVLGGTGYEIVPAESGREALEIARREPPDLVLLDLYMPDMDGEATCRALRQEPALADVPVIMVTSGSDPGEVARCVEAGCDDYVLKPIRRGPLVRKITGLVDERAFERLRVPLDVPVEFGLERGERGNQGRAVNISAGGLFVETAHVADRGCDLSLSFALPVPDGGQPVTATGRVAWVNGRDDRRKRDCGPGMGIAFRDLAGAGRSLIQKFVRIRRRAALVA